MKLQCNKCNEPLEYCDTTNDDDEYYSIWRCNNCAYEIIYKNGGKINMDAREFYSDYIRSEDMSKDISRPTTVKITDSGKTVDTKYGKRPVFMVELNDGTKKQLMISSMGMKRLCVLYGESTEQWIGKEVKLVVIDKKVVVL